MRSSDSVDHGGDVGLASGNDDRPNEEDRNEGGVVSPEEAGKMENCLSRRVTRSSVCGTHGEDGGFGTSLDGETMREDRSEQELAEREERSEPQVAQASFGSATVSIKDEGNLEAEGPLVAEKLRSTKPTVGGTDRVLRPRKGRVLQQVTVVSRPTSAGRKGNARGKKGGPDASTGATAVGEEAVIRNSPKTRGNIKRGKRKPTSETTVDVNVVDKKGHDAVESTEPSNHEKEALTDASTKSRAGYKRGKPKINSITILAEADEANQKVAGLEEAELSKESQECAGSTAVREEAVTETISKTRGSVRRGKRKIEIEVAATEILEPSTETTVVETPDAAGPAASGGAAVIAATVQPRAGNRRGKRKADSETPIINALESSRELPAVNKVDSNNEIQEILGQNRLAPNALVKEAAIQAGPKARGGNRRAKRKSDSETLMTDVLEPRTSINVQDGGHCADAVVADSMELASCSQACGEMQVKNAKLRQKGSNTRKEEVGGVAKRRRKIDPLQDPHSDDTPCIDPVVMTLNSHCEPSEGVPPANACKLSEGSESGESKSMEVVTGKKVQEVPVPRKGKKAKGLPRVITAKEVEAVLVPRKSKKAKGLTPVRSRGAPRKVPLSTKEGDNKEVMLLGNDKTLRSSAEKTDPEEVVADPHSICHGEAFGAETVEKGREDPPLKQDLRGDTVEACTGVHATRFQETEADKDLDNGAVGEDVSSGVTEGGENKESEKCIDSTDAEAGVAREGWVRCDDCGKWRCIPVELADHIESTNARWSCEDNPDKDFRACSVPQEKSNAEINAKLQISEVSVCDEGDENEAVDSGGMNLSLANEENKPAVWKLIRHNIYQHRPRKAVQFDDLYVCHCTKPKEGEVGCVTDCLNRMVNVECSAEHCPCGEACSNRQFQNRTYAPIEKYRCGKKGFGLRVTENVSKGTFIIEYVGEVLDVAAFEARQQDYARKGQKHFYFMTLGGDKVIDACLKGNHGRFINHSCEPNCQTEKWLINGEVCVGLFAIKDIAKDEEVTFDYNYVRVCGAAAKKCECGSSRCRGFIGGDRLPPQAVVGSESEDDIDLEPIMLEDSEDENEYVDDKLAPCKKPQVEAEFLGKAALQSSRSKHKFSSVKEKNPSTVKRVKTSRPARRSSLTNYKGLTIDVRGRRLISGRPIYFSDVDEKLDQMLDQNGGLRKKRDAAKNYLKLLVLTSASEGDPNDATACSSRDLSLVLDALLKTRSWTVLSDIMHKNGLRMLHNLMKRVCKHYEKRPILRKLIKVLDLLASQRVLTMDLINSSPPCSGMESFLETIYKLHSHQDSQVVESVRNFCKRWIPPRNHAYDQHYRQMQSSPAKMQHPDQVNTGSNRFHPPQYHKQACSTHVLNRLESPPVPSPSTLLDPQGGNLHPNPSQTEPLCLEEGARSKDDQGGSVKPSVIVNVSDSSKQPEQEIRVRKRPSRWDSLVRIEKSSRDPSDCATSGPQSDTQGAGPCSSGRGTCTLPVPYVSQGRSRFQFQGPRYSRNRPFLSKQRNFNRRPQRHAMGSASAWPASNSVGGVPGQAQAPSNPPTMVAPNMGSGPSPIQPGAGVPPANLPGPPAMPMCAPVLISGIPQQVPVNNVQFGKPPLPGRLFPECPPQMVSGPSSVPSMHGAPPQMPNALGCAVGPRPLPMLPIAPPYGQWQPPPGAPHFMVPPVDPSQKHALQLTWSLKVGEGPQKGENGGCDCEADLPAGGELEPEPPVPGLSPPPAPVPVPVPVSANCLGPHSHGCGGRNGMLGMESCKQWRPNYLNMSVYTENTLQSHSFDMNYPPREYRRDADARDERGGAVEFWESPEGDGFRGDVYALVMSQVQKHKLRERDLEKFCTKLADVIVRKEVAKYAEHKNQGSEKRVIVRSKLVDKVESYVYNQVELYWRKIEKSQRSETL